MINKEPLDNKTRIIVGACICIAVAVGFATIGEIAIFGFFALAYLFND